MPFLTRYGTQFGLRSARHGRTIFVAASAQYSGLASNISGGGGTTGTFGASDNNDGLSPERAVRTATYAINTLAQTGDTVILLPGTHTVTATLAPRAGVAIYGCGMGTSDIARSMYVQETNLTISAAAHLWNLIRNNIEIGYIRMYPAVGFSTVTSQTTASLTAAGDITQAITGLYIHDCQIDLGATSASGLLTAGIDLRKRTTAAGENYGQSVATVYALIENCFFNAGFATGPAIATATASVHVKGCRFNIASMGVLWASPFMVATNTQASLVENCIWTANGTSSYGDAIDGNNAGSQPLYAVQVVNCRFPAAGQLTNGIALDNFGTNMASVTESYLSGNATAVTAIT